MSLDLAARHAWMMAVCADESLSRGALAVATVIALHLNQKTGRCDPSKETLARRCGLSVRSADRSVRVLVERGWLAVEVSRGRAANNYALCMSPQLAHSNPAMGDGVEASNPVIGDQSTPSQLRRGNREENRTPLNPHGSASGAEESLSRLVAVPQASPEWPRIVEAMRQTKTPGWKPPTTTINVGAGPEPGWYFPRQIVHPRAELRLVGPAG